jgi:hypothetical protein
MTPNPTSSLPALSDITPTSAAMSGGGCRAIGWPKRRRRLVQVKYPHVQHRSLLQGSAQRPVQAILQVQLALPPDYMREQVAVEGRVSRQHRVQVEHVLSGDELVEPDRPGRDLCPLAPGPGMIGVRPPVPDLLEDHALSLGE